MAECSLPARANERTLSNGANDLFSRLRAETTEVHRQLEAELRITDPQLNVVGYRHFLIAQLGFQEPFERRFSQFASLQQLLPDYERRKKSHLLLRDLGALGLTDAEVESLPRCHELPALSTLSRVLGALYVLEGSTLGGQLILRHLQQVLPSVVARASNFIGAYGAETGAMWKVLRTSVLSASEALNHDELVDCAHATFVTVRDWFAQIQGTHAFSRGVHAGG